MNTGKKKLQNGFTMIEVLAFTLLVSIIFIGLTRIVVLSMRSSKLAQNTVLATHFAEELQEWVRGEKEEDWKDNHGLKGAGCAHRRRRGNHVHHRVLREVLERKVRFI